MTDVVESTMFDEFNTVDEKHEFEIVENGFVLRVNGRGHDDNWLAKTFVFDVQEEFYAAITRLTQMERS